MKRHIYIVNLKCSIERRRHMENQLQHCSVDFTFIDAVDGRGKALTFFKEYNSVERVKKYGCDLKNTEVATTQSHIQAMQTAYDAGVDCAIILEDDITLLPSFYNVLDIVCSLSKTIEVVRLYNRESATDFKEVYECDTFDLLRFNYTNWGGALGYVVNRGAMKKYLDNAYPIMHKADKFIAGTPKLNTKIYQLFPRVITTTDGIESDIGYEKGIKKYHTVCARLRSVATKTNDELYRYWYIFKNWREYR